MELRLRPACAEDAAIAHDLIYASAPEVFDFLFNVGRRRAKNFLYDCFREGTGLFGFRNHTILELAKGEADAECAIVGIGAVYDAVAQHRMSVEIGPQVWRGFGWLSCWRVFHRMYVSSRDVLESEPDSLHLAHLSVLPVWRRHGFATRFLEIQIETARETGYRVLELDVDPRNVAAKSLYCRLGFLPIACHGLVGVRASSALPTRLRMELLL